MNVFSMINARMHHNETTMRVASENMANLHTAGYKARTTTPLDFGETLHKISMACTNPRHIGGQSNGSFGIVNDLEGFPSLTGNTVSYARELQRANQANDWHSQMTRFYHSNMDILSEAMKK